MMLLLMMAFLQGALALNQIYLLDDTEYPSPWRMEFGEYAVSSDKLFEIFIDPHQIGVSYCQMSDILQKPKGAEFNDPRQDTFLTLDIDIKPMIDDYLWDKLQTVASLQSFGFWRCKEYFLFEWDEKLEYYRKFFVDVISNHAAFKTYDRDFPVYRQAFQNHTQILFSSSLTQDVYVRLDGPYRLKTIDVIGVVLADVPFTLTVNRKIEGEGLHQWLETEITDIPQVPGCSILVLDFLDVYTYVDKDELDKNERQVDYNPQGQFQLQTIVDIERPSSHSAQHIFTSIHHTNETSLKYRHQYHFRYQLATENTYEKSWVPRIPKIFRRCETPPVRPKRNIKDHFLSIMEDTYGHAYYEEVKVQSKNPEPLYVEVPVGYKPYAQPISVVTIAFTLGMAVYLSRVIVQSTK